MHPKRYIHIARILLLLLILSHIVTVPNANSETEKNDIPNEEIIQLENSIDLVELIKTVSDINKETYILDESVKTQEVKIITPDGGMKKEDFLKFVDVILNMNGLSIVKSDGINKVISSNRIKEESTPTIIELE